MVHLPPKRYGLDILYGLGWESTKAGAREGEACLAPYRRARGLGTCAGMSEQRLVVWCNMKFPPEADGVLRKGVKRLGHELVYAESLVASNLVAGRADERLTGADVAFGQPDPLLLLGASRLSFVHLTSAGYERYDRKDLREAFGAKGAILTNSSSVYDEPCAEHALAMMLGLARRMPQSVENQRGARGWPAAELRRECRLLVGQTVLLLGYGAIGRRLVELLAPFRMKVLAVRRTPRGDEGVATYAESEVERLLGEADHVINVLPGGTSTERFMTAQRFARMKKSAIFYNIGRGGTVDQEALVGALKGGQIAAAYMDVMTPEPLPSDHELWSVPNCFITPHTAGGHHDEHVRLVEHFLGNLERFARGESVRDRVI